MRPRPLPILLLLLAGAVVNVAVAWGLALSRNIADDFRGQPPTYLLQHDAEQQWLFFSTFEPGSTAVIAIDFSQAHLQRSSVLRDFLVRTEPAVVTIDALPRWSGLREPPKPLTPAYLQATRTDVARGWPFLAVSCRMDAVLEGDLLHKPRIEGGIRVGEFPGGTVLAERVLPYWPVWPGSALDTLFYAALLWLLVLFAPRTLRRHLRARRGLCPACAYPVGEAAVCSECGRAVSSRRSATT